MAIGSDSMSGDSEHVTQPGTNGETIAKLPFQIRPIAGEGCYPFMARLAQANCLPPAYLRRFLAGPPGYRGSPFWERLAAVTGRDAGQLRKTLDTAKCKECGSVFLLDRTFGNLPRYCSARCRSRPSLKRDATEPCRICQQPMKIQFGQRYRLCSSACRRVAYIERQRRNKGTTGEHESRTCVACEHPLPAAIPISERTCSEKCSRQVYRWDWMIERHGLPLPSRTCAFCGTPIGTKSPSDPHRRWCSRRCRTWASRGHDPATFFEPLICEQCQKTFQRHANGRDRRWCSRKCYRLSRGWPETPKTHQ
jgi:predicted nucleic acid-binding Zn ribbon protein